MVLSGKHHTSSFCKLVTDLVNKNNKQTFPDEEEINNILIDCDLEQEEKVPGWLSQFIEAVYNQQTAGPVSFAHRQKNTGDVFNFFSEMEYILEGEWDNYGEGIKIILPNLKLEILVSFESRKYDIRATE